MHAETGFEGLQNGFFGFSFGGYWRGVEGLLRKEADLSAGVDDCARHVDVERPGGGG